jgi:hypothetical protein
MARRSWDRAPPSDDRQQRGQYILFSVISTPSPPPLQCLAPTCYLSTFNLHCIAGAACLSILLERCRGSPKDDEFCPLSILFLYYRQVEDGISVLYLFDDSPSCDVYLGVEHHHDNERQVEDGNSTLYLFDDSSSCDVYLGVDTTMTMRGR